MKRYFPTTIIMTMLTLTILFTGTVSGAPQQQTSGICSRTEAVQKALLARVSGATCDTVTNTQLANITGSLTVVYYDSPTLLASDLEGLTAITGFVIGLSSSLKTVPASAFDGLTKSRITSMKLLSNGMETLESDVFQGFTSMTRLSIQNTELKTLEPGLFHGLTSVTSLTIENNRIKVLPEDIFNDLNGLTSLTLSGNDLTSLDEDTFDGLSSLRQLTLSENDLATLDEDTFDGLSSLQLLNLSENDLATLPEGTFDGLTELQNLYLDGNGLTTLPEDVFDGLTGLRRLYLHNNSLTALHVDVFDGLTGMQRLRLHNNSLTTLPEDAFDTLDSLLILRLDGNGLTALEADIFDGLDDMSTLYLSGNSLTTLHVDVFDGLTGMQSLHLEDNQLTTLEANIFEDLEDLYALYLSGNSLTTLNVEVFDSLDDSLIFLFLNDNRITSLPEDVLDGLDGLSRLDLSDNSLATVESDLFDPLDDSLRFLILTGNGITSLPEDVLDGLDGLQLLDLSDNSLATLNVELFDPLDDSFVRLHLRSNSLTALPAGIFDGLTNLVGLDLSCNALTALDLTRFDPFAGSLRFLDLTGNSFTTPPTDAQLAAKFTSPYDRIIYGSGQNTECLPSNETGLSGLTVSAGALDPAFAAPGIPGSPGYFAEVPQDVSSISIVPTQKDPKASVRIKLASQDSDPDTLGFQYNMPYGHGDNRTVVWTVRSRDGIASTSYQVTVFRAYALSKNTRLRDLTLSGVTLTETFHASTYEYIGSTTQMETKVTPELADPDATAVVRLNSIVNGNGALEFRQGENVITVEVTAEDGVTTRTYTITIPPPSVPPAPVNLSVNSRDAALSVSWQKPREDKRTPITSYDVRYRRYGSSSSWQIVSRTNDDNSTRQFVEDLTNRQAYEVQVAAVNRIGRGTWASDSAVPQGVQPAPRNPDDVLGQSRRLGELAAQWTDGYQSDAWHPDMDELSTNLILNDCMGSTGFRVSWYRPAGTPVEYEAHFITNDGAGFITHQFRTRLTSPDETVLYGSVILHRFSILTVRARARYGDRWSRWSAPVGLYCITDEGLRTAQQQHEESLAQSEETPNSPPEGNVTIRGTAQTGVRLWAITSRITDPDGMDSPGFTYQWLRDTGSGGAEIDNAFRSTYLLIDADVGSQVSVRVSFTDDDGNTETLTSDAVYVQEPPPLHGGFDTVPASHDGSSPFTFQIHFSVEPELTAANVRDHVLTVTNGAVTAASQTEPGSSTPNIRWQITVTPSGDDGVTVALSATTDCSADGAVCASDGRMLQNPSSITVSGPPEEEEETEPPPPATTPGKPTGLTATLNSDGSITLSWNAPTGDTVDGYQILRRRPRENERSLTVYVEDTGSTATTYKDTNTGLDTRYVYRVKARNGDNVSPRSNFARVDKQ